jgi:hypothetical protein
VTTEEGEEMCKRLGLLGYFETSASQNMNVDDAFFRVALRAFEIEKEMSEKDVIA